MRSSDDSKENDDEAEMVQNNDQDLARDITSDWPHAYIRRCEGEIK